MTAPEDPELFRWLCEASAHAGDFLKHLSQAGLRADHFNYAILRPALLQMKDKYPQYALMGADDDYPSSIVKP